MDDYRQLAAKDVNRPNSATLSATLISVFDRRKSGSNSTTQDIATLLTSVAITYSNKEMDLEAEELLKTILNINREIMTESKSDTQRSLWRLASWYMDRAKYEEARAAYDRLTDIQTKFYGSGHTITRTTMLDIVGVYWDNPDRIR